MYSYIVSAARDKPNWTGRDAGHAQLDIVCSSRLAVSGTTIRGIQIVVKNHPASPFKEKNQQKRDGINSSLLGLQQDM
jgi:hypothetical protein